MKKFGCGFHCGGQGHWAGLLSVAAEPSRLPRAGARLCRVVCLTSVSLWGTDPTKMMNSRSSSPVSRLGSKKQGGVLVDVCPSPAAPQAAKEILLKKLSIQHGQQLTQQMREERRGQVNQRRTTGRKKTGGMSRDVSESSYQPFLRKTPSVTPIASRRLLAMGVTEGVFLTPVSFRRNRAPKQEHCYCRK